MTTLAHILIFVWYIKSRRIAYYNTISCDSLAGISVVSVGEKLHNMIGKDWNLCGLGFFLFFLPSKNTSTAGIKETRDGEFTPYFVINLRNDQKCLIVSM